jgi:putative transposase
LTAVIGAAPGERTDTRTNLRNGHRPRTLSTTAGDLELRIPKLRTGSFFPSLLERQHFPYVFLDATYCKARVNRRVVSQAVVVATGVCTDGRREVLGFGVGDSEDGAFY